MLSQALSHRATWRGHKPPHSPPLLPLRYTTMVKTMRIVMDPRSRINRNGSEKKKLRKPTGKIEPAKNCTKRLRCILRSGCGFGGRGYGVAEARPVLYPCGTLVALQVLSNFNCRRDSVPDLSSFLFHLTEEMYSSCRNAQ